ncbi:hypothetical protein PNEG_00460 [Pneumocystis murina B123]|uniref:Uncharacterized protein n=1 Tax=Pneumocystis murina (strain B123) TaxID=1069680 RepID=M7NWC4_PNEMU|nr:hypothetical protein PNEG_00460 [Pneumocystis murina B123]EMR11441.1 hypothetical protein PNEG_00460 [Pneumocystis murina B123]
MYDYQVKRDKHIDGIRKHKSYGNLSHKMVINNCGEGREGVYCEDEMFCKSKTLNDETYSMRYGKTQKDYANYVQVVSVPNNDRYFGETQLYYNNYQIKVPEFVEKNGHPVKKLHRNNTINDSLQWDGRYPNSVNFQDVYNKRSYSENNKRLWGLSDAHLPYYHINPRHFGSAEYLNRRPSYTEQITLCGRDVSHHRYPLAEPNDMPWGIPMRSRNASMPNIGSQFKWQNNLSYKYGPRNSIKPFHYKENSTNFSIPMGFMKGSIHGIKLLSQETNNDSISLFCDDSFSSEYEDKGIESPRVILSRSINNINKLAPHSVTDNLYISNDIDLIDMDNDKLQYRTDKKSDEMYKNSKKGDLITDNLATDYQKKQKKRKNSFDGLQNNCNHGSDKENAQKHKEKSKKSFLRSKSFLSKKKSGNDKSAFSDTVNTKNSMLYEENNDMNWPLDTINKKSFKNFDTELETFHTNDMEVSSNANCNEFKLFLPQEKLEINDLSNDKSYMTYGNNNSDKRKPFDFIDDTKELKQGTLPIFSEYSLSSDANMFQRTREKSLDTFQDSSYESKISSQMLNKETDKKMSSSHLKHLKNNVYSADDPQTRLKYAKKLIQVASELSNDTLKDKKFIKKNREKYLSDAYSIVRELVNSDPPYPEAMFFLASCYGDGTLGLSVDHKQAYMLYYSASKYKHPQSIYRTAVCLEIGMGVKKNQERAVQYYQRAASLGNVTAMYKIGIILLNGLLKQVKNPRKAIFWLKKASELADEENPHALHELAILYEKEDNGGVVMRNEEYSFELYMRAAQLMYPPSQVRLGYAYEHGILGCEIDPKKSITYYLSAAEKGNPDAELGLSGWYLTGAPGILEQSDKEAYLWARKAAEKGLTKAEYVIGYYLEIGIGVKSNRAEAKIWYKRASRKGFIRAIDRLYELKKFGCNLKMPDKIYNHWQLAEMLDCTIP